MNGKTLRKSTKTKTILPIFNVLIACIHLSSLLASILTRNGGACTAGCGGTAPRTGANGKGRIVYKERNKVKSGLTYSTQAALGN